jgi:hypothetical protein
MAAFKKLLILLPFILSFISVKSQDIIITKAGDTIKCQITKIDDQTIYFRYLKRGTVEFTTIPVSEVDKYQHIYQGKEEATGGFPMTRKYSKFRLGAGGGYSYRLAKVPSNAGQFADYYKKLKSGFNIEGEGTYFFNKSLGIGVRYNFFRAKNYMDGITFILDNDTLIGDLGDDIRIQSIGPTFYFRFFNRNENIIWLLGFSFGYTSYLNKGRLLNQDLTLTGSTVGMTISFGADFLVLKNMAIGANVSLDLGTLSSYTMSFGGRQTTIKLQDQEKDNLARINLTATLRFWE